MTRLLRHLISFLPPNSFHSPGPLLLSTLATFLCSDVGAIVATDMFQN